jgi:hypothetical protein
MPNDFGKKLKLKWGDIKTRVKGDIMAIAWKDKQNINILTDMHRSLAGGKVLC